MKTIYNESENGLSIEIIPETMDEMALLLRTAKNSAAIKPSITFGFSKEIYTSIWIKKRKVSTQNNFINRETK